MQLIDFPLGEPLRMLANILAVLLGLGSFIFYIVAFFYPEVHRRSDIIWSGLGLFYAAVLWVSAGQMTGVVLLGQLTAVVLLLGLGWQTLSIRRAKTPVYQQTPVVVTPEVVSTWAKNTVNKLRIAPTEPVPLKLEKRSYKEFSAERIDPRQRPTYDYEFVEDGIGAQFPQLPVLDPQELALEPPVDRVADTVTEREYTAPPSTEAEIIRVVSPSDERSEESGSAERSSEEISPKEISPEPMAAQLSEELSEELGEPKDEAIEAADELEQAPNAEASEFVADVDESDLPDNLSDDLPDDLTRAIAEESAIDDNWGDFDDVLESADSVPTPSQQKPSLFAIPWVLVGWVKDVVSSMTKPKPSKPVIVIPRREPNLNEVKSYGVADSGVLDNEAQSDRAQTADSNWGDRPDESFEDSNWDD